MIKKIIFAFKWINVHIKIVLFATLVGVVMAFCSYTFYKNRRIFALEAKIALVTAQLELERVAVRYNTAVTDLKRLREEDDEINKRLVAIATALRSRLPEDMTAEEIAKKFMEVGL